MKTYPLLTITIFVAIVFSACSDDLLSIDEQPINQELTLKSIYTIPADSLSMGEMESLLFMVEEEKIARDIYLQLYAIWGQRAFNNISASEQQHMDAVQILLDRYSITIPNSIGEIGVFQNNGLQALHDELLSKGKLSLIEALKVGALIEEVDIKDLQEVLDITIDNEDITYVYNNLIKGSENHLRAYVNQLSKLGVEYEPQVLEPEQYQTIINQ